MAKATPVSAPAPDVASTATPEASVTVEDTPILSAALTGKGRRILITLVVGVLAVAVVRELSQQTRGARGPAASSYATSPAGLAALDGLLRRQGVEVVQLTRPIDEAIDRNEVSIDDRLVVLDQSLSPRETEALATFVRRGGSLLGGGSRSAAWIGRLWNGDEASDDNLAEVRPGAAGQVTTIGDTLAIRTLTTARTPLVWRGLGELTPVVVDREFGVVLAQQISWEALGFFDALADPSILSNATLSSSDNAIFALELLGSGRRVVFAEAGHGFRSGAGSGLSAIPSNVRTLLLGFVLAVLVWMLAVGRRIGGPDLPDRPLPPGRFEHVGAVASLLDRAERKNRTAASDDGATTPTQPKDA